MNFKTELQERTDFAEAVIEKYLPEEHGFSGRMAEAVNYSMKAGGKRLRPVFMREAYQILGGEGEIIEPFMAALEMVHTHSLIHDDLPALDNDEYRRGKKTTHIVFGEAAAILAGDALLNYAYETAFSAFDMAKNEAELHRVAEALKVLAQKTGIKGMLGGQGVDVENDGKPLEKQLLDYIYENKTSALIEAALMVGGILAGASDIEKLEQIGSKIGIAFQIQDDILDVISSAEELGKPIGSDEKNNKTTYVTLEGIEKAGNEVQKLTDEAVGLLRELTDEKSFLEELFQSLCARRK
ncbi:MAG: farnesyl diphosphate synthase [Blautia sp.]|nr:farnesyl diphosphate synthase [Blautia sp.]